MYDLIENSYILTNLEHQKIVQNIKYKERVPLSAPPEEIAKRISNPNKDVLNIETIYIIYYYPLSNAFICEYNSTTGFGFTKLRLVELIAETYRQIYGEEEATTKRLVIPMEERMKKIGLMNRNQTDGKYGIWGHDLEDLSLNHIKIIKYNNRYYLIPGIDS